MFYAAKNGHSKMIQILFENGLSVNQIDTYGQNPIYYSISVNKNQTTMLLKALGS